MPLEKAINDFWQKNNIERISQIIISLKASRTVLKRRLGNSPAVIVTEGFEHWVDMNLPAENQQFTLQPHRASSPLNGDLVFGLHERMDQQGNIIHEVNEKELEFLASKLQMSKVDTVCICLIHSNKNNDNEIKVQKYFENLGFRVFCSHTTNSKCNERERWLGAILNGYLASTVKDQLEDFLQLAVIEGNSEKISLSTGKGLAPIPSSDVFSSLQGDIFLLNQVVQKQEINEGLVYHFGLEECFLLFPNQEPQNSCLTDLGLVGGEVPQHLLFQWNFTQPLQTRFWGVGQPANESIGYEPGPMCFGRGLQPTLLDLLFLDDQLNDIPGLSDLIDERTRPRILDELSSLVKELKQEMLDRDHLQYTMKLALFELASVVSSESIVYFSGPFAMAMKTLLKKHFAISHVQLTENFQFPSMAAINSFEVPKQ